jgi:hypothetical protein
VSTTSRKIEKPGRELFGDAGMTTIMMDLQADFAALCATFLTQAGFTPPTGSEEIILAYLTVRHRRVDRRPRRVHKTSYVVPPELAAGEAAFLADVSAGADLQPYQSLRIDRPNVKDGMLNDFGIHHFHLGIGPHPTNPKFKERTEPVMFAFVQPDDLYALGCFPHGAWTQQALLDLIYAEWPQLLEPYRMKGVVALAREFTDGELATLRANNVNAMTTRPDGTVHFAPGGGHATDGTPMAVSMELMHLQRSLADLERQIRPLVAHAIVEGRVSAPAYIRLTYRGGDAFAVVNGGPAEVPLEGIRRPAPLA